MGAKERNGETKSENVIVKLSKPIPHGDEFVEELEIKPPTAKDMRHMPLDQKQMTMGHFLTVLESTAALPTSVIDKLTSKDLMRAVEVVANFLDDGQ